MLTAAFYLLYLGISIGVTVWVARTLSRNGRVFLVNGFGAQDIADSVNHMLVVGFYLVNIGYVTLALKTGARPADVVEGIEFLSTKVGFVLVVLGAMHLFNVFVIARWGRVMSHRAGHA
ncbi:MAG TPA: hypothetical protein VJ724_09815 [Tahibacter sp.]|nr:hypothetical protein [Tahibacter sp.]